VRGLKQSCEQIKVLQEKWPAGFPTVPSKVRPLVTGTSKTIAEALGWSVPYTRGVLLVWKNRTAYCNAVLRYRERINLDGLVSGEEVDDRARVLAQQQLARIALEAVERAAAEQAARTAAEAETAAAEVTTAPAPAPPPLSRKPKSRSSRQP
jgi:sRNA-binding protein